jgi:hypothetical protein
MTKSIGLFILFIFAITFCYAQSFEGKITYKNSYKSKIPTFTDEQFTAMMGSSQEFNMKGGNYQSSLNGTLVQWQVYVNKDNKIYSKFSNSPAVLWNDAAVNSDSVLSAKINKSVIDILGYKCDELILTCRSGIQKYYFNPKLKIDSNLFQNFKFQNWYEYVSRAKAVPLKMIIDNAQFSLESTATEVLPQKIDDALFALPPNVTLEKNPY